jgi:ABC-2 type transport system ATP-binding protein
MLGAVLRPTCGAVRVNGYDVVAESDVARRTIGILTEQPGLYLRMSGLEYLAFFGRLYGLEEATIRSRTVSLFERFDMEEMLERRLGTYSKGMRQKVGLIRAMLHDPDVLLLDEPTSAMDPHSARLVREAIKTLRKDRRSIVLCTHNLMEAELLADRIAIINRGHIVCTGTPGELKKRVFGQPLMEVQLDQAPNGVGQILEGLVTVEQISGNAVRYRAGDPDEANPRVVRRLSEAGLGVVSLSEVPYSLEDVYLSVLNHAGEAVRQEE